MNSQRVPVWQGVDFRPFDDVQQSVHEDVAALRVAQLGSEGVRIWGAVYDTDTDKINYLDFSPSGPADSHRTAELPIAVLESAVPWSTSAAGGDESASVSSRGRILQGAQRSRPHPHPRNTLRAANMPSPNYYPKSGAEAAHLSQQLAILRQDEPSDVLAATAPSSTTAPVSSQVGELLRATRTFLVEVLANQDKILDDQSTPTAGS